MRQVIILSGLCLLFTFCSPLPKLENSNTRIYVEGDTVVEFHLLDKEKGVKADFDRVYYWYSGQQIGHSQGAYMGRLLDGDYLVKLRCQQLVEKGVFEEGQKEGEWLVWHPNGRIKERQEWEHGLLDGTLEEYDESGKLLRSSEYKRGALHGKRTTYLEGERKHVQEFDEGELEGDEKNAPGLLGRIFKKKNEASEPEDKKEVESSSVNASLSKKGAKEEKPEGDTVRGSGELQSGGKKKAGFFQRLFGGDKEDSKDTEQKEEVERPEREGRSKVKDMADRRQERQLQQRKKGKRSGQLQMEESEENSKDGFFKRLFGGSEEKTKEEK